MTLILLLIALPTLFLLAGLIVSQIQRSELNPDEPDRAHV
ncbi:hypothetical protein BJ973_003800 [Actinoplanes tereljensis]